MKRSHERHAVILAMVEADEFVSIDAMALACETSTQTIRRDKRFRALPIIALTTNVMAGDRERCLDAGMNDHLAKPVDTGALFDSLVKWAATSGQGN